MASVFQPNVFQNEGGPVGLKVFQISSTDISGGGDDDATTRRLIQSRPLITAIRSARM